MKTKRTCENCGSSGRVTDTRQNDDGTIRRLSTCSCGNTWSTLEVPTKEYRRLVAISKTLGLARIRVAEALSVIS